MEKRGRTLKVRVTEAEAERLKAEAEEAGISVSELVRKRSLGQEVRQKRKPRKVVHVADPELVRQVARIGNNLNQIARRVNGLGRIEADALQALISIDRQLRKLTHVE